MRSVKSVRRGRKGQIGKNTAKRKNNAQKKALAKNKGKRRQQSSGKAKWQMTEAAEGSNKEQKQQQQQKWKRKTAEGETTKDNGRECVNGEKEERKEKVKVKERRKEERSRETHNKKSEEEQKAVGRECVNGEKRETKETVKKEEHREKEKEKTKENREDTSKEIIVLKKKEVETTEKILAMKSFENSAVAAAHLEETNGKRKEEGGEKGQQRGENGQTNSMENGVGEKASEKERKANGNALRGMAYGGIPSAAQGEHGEETVKTDQQQQQQHTQRNGGDTQFTRNVHELVSAMNGRMEIQRVTTAPQTAENGTHRPITPIQIEPLRLERITRRAVERKERKPREHKLLEMDMQYCEHMISKHGDDYEAMSRDPMNAMGDPPTAIQRKLRIYRDFLKQKQQSEATTL